MCRANIKVSSTETGAIFGNIVYESTAYADRSVVVLNDIHIDIMDYISPASCPDVQFRSMWAEFEWENKVGHSFACVDDCSNFALHAGMRKEKEKRNRGEKSVLSPCILTVDNACTATHRLSDCDCEDFNS